MSNKDMASAINRVMRATFDSSPSRYRDDGGFVRWGLVETDLVEAALAVSRADLARVEGDAVLGSTLRPKLASCETALQQAERDLARVEGERDNWIEREAAICPEDVGFEELIRTLQRQCKRMAPIVELAREMFTSYIRDMDDNDPHKGAGNRMADMIAAYDAAPPVLEE